MSAEDQLLHESRLRTRQTAVAIGAGALLIVAPVLSRFGAHAKVNELTLGLFASHHRVGLDVTAAVFNALAYVAVAWTLVYLFGCARARSSQAAGFIPWLPAIGAPLAGIVGIAYTVALGSRIDHFVSTGAQTYDEAAKVYQGTVMNVLQVVALVAALFIAVGFVLVALQAMRVGLLPRLMGYVGMLAGALVIFQIGGILSVIVQLYWLLAVAYLISGRWPSGLPAAWTTGRAEALPTAAEVRARRTSQAEQSRAARRGGRGARSGGDAEPAQTVIDEPPAATSKTSGNARSSAKRKRKRKR